MLRCLQNPWFRSFSTASSQKNPIVPVQKLRMLDLSLDRLTSTLQSLDQPKYRSKQLWTAVFKNSVRDFSQLSTVGKKDKDLLGESFVLRYGDIEEESRSKDGTIKWLFDLPGPEGTCTNGEVPMEMDVSISSAKKIHLVKRHKIETVYIPEFRDATGTRSKARGTLCVSSQSGCSLQCTFCHTGTQAMKGNLTSSDILEQILLARSRIDELNSISHQSPRPSVSTLHSRNNSRSRDNVLSKPSRGMAPYPGITHFVFMGQGEPLLNFRQVKQAIEMMTHPDGLGISPRRITISTSGVAPVIPRIARELPGVRLALSLHAPNDELRSKIMGINDQWSIAEVMHACKEYVLHRIEDREKRRSARIGAAHTDNDDMDSDGDSDDEMETENDRISSKGIGKIVIPARSAVTQKSIVAVGNGRYSNEGSRRIRVTFEYVMLQDVNDSPMEARELVELLKKYFGSLKDHIHVNLIPFNPWPEAIYKCSDRSVIENFAAYLRTAGIETTVRKSRGRDIFGACGQLKSIHEKKQRLSS